MKTGSRLSIRFQLIRMTLLVMLIVMILHMVLSIMINVRSINKDLQQEVSLNADLVAEYCVVPMVFNDSEGVREVLQKLEKFPDIAMAVVYDINQDLMAQYANTGASQPGISLEKEPKFVNYAGSQGLHISKEILHRNKHYGNLHLLVSTERLHNEITRSIGMTILLLVVALLLTAIIAQPLQKSISNRIMHLTATMHQIAQSKDYMLRAVRESSDEIGVLSDGFNKLLEQINLRDQANEEYLHQLELSDKKYRDLFENLIEGFALHEMIFDENGNPWDYRFLIVNPAFCSMTGLVAEDVVGRTIREIFPGISKDTTDWIKEYGQVTVSGQAMVLEAYSQIIGKWFLIHAFQSQPGQFASVITDISSRKKTEEELMEANRLLKEMGSIAKIGGWEFDVTTGEGSWTEEVAKIHGLAPDVPATMETGLSFYTPECRKIIEMAIKEAIENHVPYELELELIAADNSLKWVHTIGSPQIEDGKVKSLRGSFQDITASRNKEVAQRKQEERYRTLVKGMINGFAYCKMLFDQDQQPIDWEYIDINDAFIRITGMPASIIGKRVNDLNPEIKKTMPELFRFYGRVMRAGVPENLEIQMASTGKWLNINAYPCDSDKFIAIIQDITLRKEAQVKLQQLNNRLSVLRDIDKDLIQFKRPQTIADSVLARIRDLVNCDRVSLYIFDRGRSELVCLSQHVYKGHVEDKNLRIRMTETHLNEIFPQGNSMRINDLQHEDKNLSGIGKLMSQDKGARLVVPLIIGNEIHGILLVASQTSDLYTAQDEEILTEITNQLAVALNQANLLDQVEKHNIELEERVETRTRELKKIQEELVTKERLAVLGHFAGSISHELRNPLGVIDSSLYYLRMKLKQVDTKIQNHLERMGTSVNNATAIIESLLSMTNLRPPHLERQDMVLLISDIVKKFKSPRAVKIETKYPKTPIIVTIEREQFRIVIKNLLKNAVEAMNGTGLLSVMLSRADNNVCQLTIKDSGSGIEPDNIDKVFTPLFSTKTHGIGFGLSICKMIVTNHNGTIEVDSKPDEGAEFIIKLPCETACSEPQNKS